LPSMSRTATASSAHNGATAEDGATAARKGEHIRINLEEDVAFKGVAAGFDQYRLVHRALPEIDLADVRLDVSFLGHRVGAPVLVSCMTGGTEQAGELNRRLARAAQQRGLAMGVGSCRVLLEHADVLPSFDVRPDAPDVLLFANLGAVQLNRGVTADGCRRIVELLRADALVLHLNPLQEALQPEGDTCFAGLLSRIEALCAELEVPVVVKEVGFGINAELVRRLLAAGVSAVDVAGAGGTSWSEVERHRLRDPVRARVAAAFAGWGIPSAQAIAEARRAAPDAALIASGGVRSGIDVAVAIALGADLVGAAGPLLRAANDGEESLAERLDQMLEELRIAMFCTGSATPAALRGSARPVRGEASA
jgi:isopentenyl-diphosphate Delta-isomerase